MNTIYTDRIPSINQVAILGAGVMGAQIAAHFANAGIQALLFDLPVEGRNASKTAHNAIKALYKQKPEPLMLKGVDKRITPCNYNDDLEKLSDCSLVIEAIAERLEWKIDLYEKIAPHLNDKAILATNTSGISITQLSEGVPAALQTRFLGIHFFNPPRYMPLVELIAHDHTDAQVMDNIESFLTSSLGKSVVRAKDTVNFIANRLGIFSIMVTLYHAERLGINFETVDELTGKKIGRPKSATLRTADVVGLDTMRHVINGVIDNLPDDPWSDLFKMPAWLDTLVENGALGQKTRKGVYKKEGSDILVYDTKSGDYRKRKAKVPGKVDKVLKLFKDPERLAKLRSIKDPHAEFLWAIHRDVFHYSAYWLADIAENTRDVDLAIRWGFGWKQGPFEIWQHAGWKEMIALINEDIAAGKTPCSEPLPAWVDNIDVAHTPEGSWSARVQAYQARSTLPVYQRQRWPETVLGEATPKPTVLFENDAARFWLADDDIGVLSFKTKMHTMNEAVLTSLHQAVDMAEEQLRGMVIWHPEAPFSAGADLKSFMPVALKSLIPGSTAMEDTLQRFQSTCMRMRLSNVPIVAGVHGLTLGGGCELQMQCDRVVAASESYVGLVEVGVGLLPAGSGCMELARRASINAGDGELFPYIQKAFETVAMGKVATSAFQAREMGFFRNTDIIVMNSHEVLHAALAQVKALDAANYREPTQEPIRASGRAAMANLQAAMTNMHAGGFISDYDMKIGTYVAEALTGGDIDADTTVSEEWFLQKERNGFKSLLKSTKTHARVKHMLDKGKPLRN